MTALTASGRQKLRTLGLALGLVLLLAAIAGVGTAQATEGIASFKTETSTNQAGDHPDLQTSFALESPGLPEAAENVIVETPEGVFGNPNAVESCTSVVFANQECAPTTQVGLITVRAKYEGDPNFLLGTAPIYDLAPSEAETALFGFIVPTLNIPIQIPVGVRTGSDYGLNFKVSEITQVTPLAGANMTFWGFPADNAHKGQRFPKGSAGRPAGCVGLPDTSCIATPTEISFPVHPLTDNPNFCDGQPQTTRLRVQTYQDPDNFSVAEDSYPPVTGCEKQLFKPLLYARPTSTETDSPSGLDIELKDTQFLGFAVSPSPIHDATVNLPAGLTINPDAADGQTACTDAQANFDSEEPANCPDSAKIGTTALHTPALAGPLPGSLYIGEPKPGDQYRLFLVVNGFGIHAKLVGSVQPDPLTGQVSVHFEDLPQVPFDSFDVHLFSSDRGLMATPTYCTTYKTEATFVPWNDVIPTATSNQVFGLTSGPNGTPCPGQLRPFHPTLSAGTSSSLAGAFSAFSLQLDRNDGDQFLGDLTFRMPPGFTGDLRGISYCSDAAIEAATQNSGRGELASPSCPASSLVGTTNVAAGPGNHPFHAVGKMYLSGPFKGAPLSVAAVTPALAGPYDYGVVVVRVALHVDPQTAQVFAASDTVPSIIGGIPIRMRSIRVNIDRQNFTINPTNCSQLSVESQGIGDQGTVADFSSPFHADNCSTMGFQPRMKIRQLGGRKKTKRATNAGLQLDLWTRPGDANLRSLSVTLPKDFEIDQRHLSNLCSERQLTENQCAGRTPIGSAMTDTPLLDQPLAGNVYAVSGSGGLPRLAFLLNGQVDLMPRADTKTAKGKLKTTVPVIPDAAVGHFTMKVFGGKTGYLVNTRDLCAKTPVVNVEYTGQNGITTNQNVKVSVPCPGKKGSSKHLHR